MGTALCAHIRELLPALQPSRGPRMTFDSDDLTTAHRLAEWLDLEGPTDAADALREALQ